MSSSISWQSRDESSRSGCPPIVHQRDERSLEIDGKNSIHADSEGKHSVAADCKIAYLNLKEALPCWKREAANIKETIESFVADMRAHCALHEDLRKTISTLENIVKELRAELPSGMDEYSKIITHLEQDIAQKKIYHAELEQTITSVLTKIHDLCAPHEKLYKKLVAAEDVAQELRALISPLFLCAGDESL